MTPDPIAYHLVPAARWGQTPAGDPFRPASLEAEGFVHLTHRMADLVDIANELYRHEPGPHVVLTIALRWLRSPWRYDGDERFPHVYGPLDRAAITEVRPIERSASGEFLPIERPDERRPPDVAALLRHLLEAEVRFVVVGSAGAALLGAHLEPGDLDICPALDRANLVRLARVLESVGARPRVGVPGWVTEEEAASWRPTPDVLAVDLLYETRLGDLDVMPSVLGPEGRGEMDFEMLSTDATTVDLDGLAIPVAPLAMLLASKLGARRPKDVRARAELERLAADIDRRDAGRPA